MLMSHSCPHPSGKPGQAQTFHLCDSFPSSSVQKALQSHRGHRQPHRQQCLEVARWPKLWVPWQSTTLTAGFWSECNCVLLTQKKKKPFGELPKSKRRCMHWLASATIHQDSAEIGLGNVLGNFIFLWSFVIIDRHRFNHSSQEITPDASCSSLWIALNRLLKLRDYFLRWKSIFLIMSNLLENEGTYCSLFSCHLC